ncbi:hypothetical protein AAG906_025436 [Vitis piasezkii]
MAIETIFDPRYKIKILEFYFPLMYGINQSLSWGKNFILWCFIKFNSFELNYDEQDPLSKFDLFVHNYYLEESILPRTSNFDGAIKTSQRLHPNTLEALMCAQSWLWKEKEGSRSGRSSPKAINRPSKSNLSWEAAETMVVYWMVLLSIFVVVCGSFKFGSCVSIEISSNVVLVSFVVSIWGYVSLYSSIFVLGYGIGVLSYVEIINVLADLLLKYLFANICYMKGWGCCFSAFDEKLDMDKFSSLGSDVLKKITLSLN